MIQSGCTSIRPTIYHSDAMGDVVCLSSGDEMEVDDIEIYDEVSGLIIQKVTYFRGYRTLLKVVTEIQI